MAQVAVTIAGRVYRMACGEGEEDHLQRLGRRLDAKITELRTSFGEIGDQRITIMAALTVADSLAEAESRLTRLEAEVAAFKLNQADASASVDAVVDAVAVALDAAAARIEAVSRRLGPPPPA